MEAFVCKTGRLRSSEIFGTVFWAILCIWFSAGYPGRFQSLHLWRYSSPAWTVLVKEHQMTLLDLRAWTRSSSEVHSSLGHIVNHSCWKPKAQYIIQTVFFAVQMGFPVFQFVVHMKWCPVTGHPWKEPGSVLFAPSIQVFICIGRILQSLLSSMLNSSSSPSLSSKQMLQSLHLCDPVLVFLWYVHLSFREEPRTWTDNWFPVVQSYY